MPSVRIAVYDTNSSAAAMLRQELLKPMTHAPRRRRSLTAQADRLCGSFSRPATGSACDVSLVFVPAGSCVDADWHVVLTAEGLEQYFSLNHEGAPSWLKNQPNVMMINTKCGSTRICNAANELVAAVVRKADA